MSALTLYQVFDDLDAWSNSLELAETDEQRAEIAARISEYLQLGAEKVDRFNAFLAHLDAQEELAKKEEERLASRRRAIGRVRDSLEAYAVGVIESTGRKKLEGNTSSLGLRQRPASVRIDDASQVPAQFVDYVINANTKALLDFIDALPASDKALCMTVLTIKTSSADKTEIKKAIQSGVDVPGATLVMGQNSLVRK